MIDYSHLCMCVCVLNVTLCKVSECEYSVSLPIFSNE